MFKKFLLLFGPEGGGASNTGGIATETPDALGELDDTDFLGEGADDTKEEDSTEEVPDEKETPDEDVDEDETTAEDETDETDETDEEAETEEEETTILADGKISVKALKEQYPDIFKKNPGLKDVIFRERAFSKRFGSVEDAEEAFNKSESFDNFENTLLRGGIGQLLDAIADTDQSAALKCAENFLPELYARSKPIFAKVTMPIIKGVLRNTFTRAQNQGNKQLALACQYVSRDLFETPDVLKATEIEDNAPDPREDEINRKSQELFNQQITNSRNDILNVVKSRLARDITARIPGNLSDFTKQALVDKITDELDATLVKDKAHMTHLSSLWKKMSKAGFSSEAKSRIISASLGRARQVLPAVIAKVKAQQKNGNNKPVTGEKKETKGKSFPNQTSSKVRTGQPQKLDRNMSDFEFLSK